MKVILALFLCLFLNANEINATINADVNESLAEYKNITVKNLSDLKEKLTNIDNSIKNNIWITRYANYGTYQSLQNKLKLAQNELEKNKKEAQNFELERKIASLKSQLQALREFESSPFSDLLTFGNIEEAPKITNPIALIGGFSYLKHLKALKNENSWRLNELKIALSALTNKKELLENFYKKQNFKILDEKDKSALNSLKNSLNSQISDFEIALDVAVTTYNIHIKSIDDAINSINQALRAQIKQSASIFGAVLIIFLVGLVLKIIIKRYLSDNQKFYTINKFINITGSVIIILILLFAYIENVDYLITILGFASAGLAIAMKDMFMSLLGWSVIIAGGSFHVGDRVRVRFQNSDVVGDIIDISLLRITLYEDITLTTYKQNRRSGRIIFVPNNYIFTETIANYTHGGMKTVWDGIDVMVSFDSNHKKAVYIIKNIARQYSKGYTDIAKIKMNKLREQYSIKNTNVEPRIFTFFEPYGINISVWYQTNSYGTLGLRSTISAEIIEAINKEPDIQITYPKQDLFLGKNKRVDEFV